MRNRYLSLLVIVVLALCLVSGIIPSAAVSAARDSGPALSYAGPSETEAVPLVQSTQMVVFVVTGLVCVLFTMIAVSPLLIDEPAQSLPEVNRKGG